MHLLKLVAHTKVYGTAPFFTCEVNIMAESDLHVAIYLTKSVVRGHHTFKWIYIGSRSQVPIKKCVLILKLFTSTRYLNDNKPNAGCEYYIECNYL